MDGLKVIDKRNADVRVVGGFSSALESYKHSCCEETPMSWTLRWL